MGPWKGPGSVAKEYMFKRERDTNAELHMLLAVLEVHGGCYGTFKGEFCFWAKVLGCTKGVVEDSPQASSDLSLEGQVGHTMFVAKDTAHAKG